MAEGIANKLLPEDIIIKSGGIGPNANQDEGNMNAENTKTLYGSGPQGYGGNERMAKTLEKNIFLITQIILAGKNIIYAQSTSTK